MNLLRPIALLLTVGLAGCIPKIEVSAPKEPLTINMNVKIEHTIHIDASRKAAEMIPTDKKTTQTKIQ